MKEHDVDHTKALTHLSLCAEYGGIDLGLKRAIRDVRTVAYSEISDFPCANLVAKMEAEGQPLDPAPIWTDLKTFPWAGFRGRVDILTGGFPCQPFSAAGRRRGDEDPRHLWPHIVRGIGELGRPPIVFFENVEGLLSSKLNGDDWPDPAGTPVLLHVLRELERLGYGSTAGVFSASEIGAPHQRKRVFILGVRSNLTAEGRALVSRLLASTGGERVAHTDNAGDPALRYETDPLWTQGSEERGRRDALGQSVGRGAHQRRDAYPAGRGQRQYAWEPPRVIARGASQSEVGGDADGSADRLGLTELSVACGSRTDELILLGNGVVPAVAERAFRVLWERIC
jgi:DNA (cytosine-5)-methyltransferase 1